MKSLSEIFIRRPVMTVLLVLSVILAGIFSYLHLPVSDLPVVDYPIINVRAVFPGMDPQMIAANIASPLEEEFMQISGVEQVTSSSMQGVAMITLQFNLDKSIDSAATDVQSAITRASGQLPQDMPAPPVYEKTDPNGTPIYFLNLSSDLLSSSELYDLADREICNKISILDGVSKVNVYGVKRAIRIELDTDKLYNKGITISDVIGAVRTGTVSMAAGALKGKRNSIVLKPKGQLEKAKDYQNIIIAYKEGAPIYLKDVGDAVDGVESNDVRMRYWNRDNASSGNASVALAVTRAAGANAIEISKAIQKLIPQINQQLPSSVKLTAVHDRAQKIIESINDVKETLIIAFLLVVAVIFLFLGRMRETLIPVVALPLSLLITFAIMYLLGYSLDNLSLLALTLAIGFLVDDAIVFLENVVRRMEKFGETPLQASIEGGKEITFTILSMTLSLAAVFIPMIFMPGQLGRVFREFSITIVVAILASGIVSITVTPMMCARLLKPIKEGSRTLLERFANALERQFLRFYGATLRWFLKFKLTSFLIWGICTVATYFVFMQLPKTFLPEGDSGIMMGVFIAKEGTSPQQMHCYQDQVRGVLTKNENIEQIITVAGLTGMMQGNQGFVIAFLKEGRRKSIQEIAGEVSKDLFMIPGALTFLQPAPNLQINTGSKKTNQGKYAFALTSQNFDELVEPAQKLQMAMLAHPGFASVSSDLFLQNPEIEIDFLREQASLYGVDVASIENEIKNAFSENYAYLIKGDTDQYKVILTTKEGSRHFSGNLNELYVHTRSGSLTPFPSVAKVKNYLGPVTVNHINNINSVTLYFNLKENYAIGDAAEFISKKAGEILPPSVVGAFQGEAATFAETMRMIVLLLFVAIFVMYTILGILYESYIHPITVLSSLTIAMLGGVATLLIFNQELSLYGCIGIFMLLGIVKKNGIMIVDFAIARRREGLSYEDAIHEASMARFRPIIMTTLAALMGMVPIAIGWGADGASRIPLGLCVVGGLIFSQIVTLYVTPVIYVCMEYFQDKILDKIPFLAREIQ
ncbi:MAG: efflux RND transporter permease subunit [Puniceicoccales bacterium]|jgi:HAE1 family hydrophobic/amphiphilic exporter-1|nr:efflux RND transporter permease subunit [Puniceicoccales bacterium]